MGFQDRLDDDVERIFFGAKVHEEDLVHAGVTFQGTVDIESFNTGAGVENEANRSISKLCTIYAPASAFITNPAIYDVIAQVGNGINWSIKQLVLEHGMWSFSCTADETRRRGRIR